MSTRNFTEEIKKMGNLVYENFYLANEVEDQFNSHLDLTQFMTVHNELTGQPGMDFIVHRYKATDSVEDLAQGVGNDSDSEASFVEDKYTIKTAQGRFKWFDEEEKKDPIAIQTGVRHLGTDMYNHINADSYAEYKKAVKVVPVSSFDFAAFCDAESMFNSEADDLASLGIFGFVNPADVAEVRKKLEGELKYVEAFARAGYIGTVAGLNLYTKKDADRGLITIATKEAVGLFNKTGVEYEPERDANTRMNRSYVRKYYVVALEKEDYAVLLMKGSAALSEDTSVDSSKKYYAASGLGYIQVAPAAGDNPVTKGWYEITPSF